MELWGQRHAPAALPPEKEIWYAINVKLRGPQTRAERS